MLTVCIATYNGEKYIRQQLNSVLIQLGPAGWYRRRRRRTARPVRDSVSPAVHFR